MPLRGWRQFTGVVLCLAAPGCLSTRTDGHAGVGIAPANVNVALLRETDFRCARAVMDRYSPYRMPLAGPEQDPELARYLSWLPPEARRAALAAGLEPLLARLLRERETAVATPGLPGARLGEMEEELTLRLVAFHSQLEAAAFEAGCTADMIQKLLAERGHREQSRQVSIAVASLVAGAIAGVAAGAWAMADQESRGPPVMAIAGGIASTALGGAALVHQDQSVVFQHPRNRLVPVWRGADPDHLYPSFVFRMLTLPVVTGGRTPREDLLAAWQQLLAAALPPAEWPGVQRTLMSDGGTYNEDLFTLRASMFESLESAVRGMARDLELLDRALVRVLGGPAPPAPPGG